MQTFRNSHILEIGILQTFAKCKCFDTERSPDATSPVVTMVTFNLVPQRQETLPDCAYQVWRVFREGRCTSDDFLLRLVWKDFATTYSNRFHWLLKHPKERFTNMVR